MERSPIGTQLIEKQNQEPLSLPELREQLDILDAQLVKLLAARFKVTQNVGLYKKENSLPPVDPSREAAQFERMDRLATDAGLKPEFARAMLRLIIDEVVINHKEIQGIQD